MLDPEHVGSRGLWSHLRRGWREARAIERIAITTALAVGLPGAIVGTIEIYRSIAQWLRGAW